MTGSGPDDCVQPPDEETAKDTAKHMADALTYLARVAREAGYHGVAADLVVVRDKMGWIARAEEAARRKHGGA